MRATITSLSLQSEISALELRQKKILVSIKGIEICLNASNSNVAKVSSILQQRIVRHIVAMLRTGTGNLRLICSSTASPWG